MPPCTRTLARMDESTFLIGTRSMSLADGIVALWQLLTYQHIDNSQIVNEEAFRWANENKDRLPLNPLKLQYSAKGDERSTANNLLTTASERPNYRRIEVPAAVISTPLVSETNCLSNSKDLSGTIIQRRENTLGVAPQGTLAWSFERPHGLKSSSMVAAICTQRAVGLVHRRGVSPTLLPVSPGLRSSICCL